MTVSMENRKMFIIAYCLDHAGPEAVQAREDHMEGHLDHVASLVNDVAIAGPMFDEAGTNIVGSVLVYKTEDMHQARAWLEADPYYNANVWERVDLRLMRGALGDQVGGISW